MEETNLEEESLKKKLEELEREYSESLSQNHEDNLPELPESSDSEEVEIPAEDYEDEKEQREEDYDNPEAEEQEIPREIPVEEIKPVAPAQKLPGLVHKIIKPITNRRFQQTPNNLSGKINPVEIKRIADKISILKKEISKVLVGQDEIVEGLIRGLLCNSHVLVEGVPGIAKTLAIRALAATSGCSVKRVQFTVDMLPTDIIGVTTYTPEKGFEIIKGPIFANFLIADEINRAPPKTQSALIEGMQEKQVTIGRETFSLPNPFFVMATENPIENAGVYPLPEAQIDRFLFKLIMGYPGAEEEKKVMDTNMTIKRFEEFDLKPVVNPKDIVAMQDLVKKVYLDEAVKDYILAIVKKTRDKDFDNAQYISYGCSPRASIGLFIASKANALMNGRDYVLPEDVRKIAMEVLRHRIILSYKASIQKISPDMIIKEILDSVKVE